MKRSFKVKNIDCAACAAKLEAAVNKIDGCDKASVSFMTQRLTVEAPDDRFEDVLNEAEAVCKKIEPDWVIVR